MRRDKADNLIRDLSFRCYELETGSYQSREGIFQSRLEGEDCLILNVLFKSSRNSIQVSIYV